MTTEENDPDNDERNEPMTTTPIPVDHHPVADHDDPLGAIRRCPFCARYLCAVCGQPIGKRRKARWTDTHRVVCLPCCDRRGREAHRIAYPDCREHWHDCEDHTGTICTHGGLRRMIAEGGQA